MQDSGKQRHRQTNKHIDIQTERETERDAHVDTEKKTETRETGIKRVCMYKAHPRWICFWDPAAYID